MTTILSVSLPSDLRSVLDAEAKRQRRSRSFVVAEAVRAYVDSQTRDAFEEARTRTLREGLALTPPARLDLAEQLWQELAQGRTPSKTSTATFNTFDEYEQWRRQGGGR